MFFSKVHLLVKFPCQNILTFFLKKIIKDNGIPHYNVFNG